MLINVILVELNYFNHGIIISDYHSQLIIILNCIHKMPTSPSGIYLIANLHGETQYVYCDLEELCGSDEGWTRVAYLDMTVELEH